MAFICFCVLRFLYVNIYGYEGQEKEWDAVKCYAQIELYIYDEQRNNKNKKISIKNLCRK